MPLSFSESSVVRPMSRGFVGGIALDADIQ